MLRFASLSQFDQKVNNLQDIIISINSGSVKSSTRRLSIQSSASKTSWQMTILTNKTVKSVDSSSTCSPLSCSSDEHHLIIPQRDLSRQPNQSVATFFSHWPLHRRRRPCRSTCLCLSKWMSPITLNLAKMEILWKWGSENYGWISDFFAQVVHSRCSPVTQSYDVFLFPPPVLVILAIKLWASVLPLGRVSNVNLWYVFKETLLQRVFELIKPDDMRAIQSSIPSLGLAFLRLIHADLCLSLSVTPHNVLFLLIFPFAF